VTGQYQSYIGPTNSTAITAQNDLMTAYTDAANATPADNLTTAGGTTELGNQTLIPGVYKVTNDALLDGTLTLNGEGQTNPTFIFQLAVSLTTGSGSNVVLENGASGCALFWQVTSAAVLGSTTDFQGNLMAASGITMGSGSNIGLGGGVDGGRALVSTSGPLTSAGSNEITPPPIGCAFAAATTTSVTTPTTGAFGLTPGGIPVLELALALFAVGVLTTSAGLWMRRSKA